jgi:hypothetical protein
MGQLAPVLTAQRADLADQVTAAVDDGHLDALAQLAVPTQDAAGLLYRAMAAVAAQAAGRMIGEAAGQGVTIDPARVRVNHARLRQIAQARAAMAGQALAAAASRRALQVVSASKGTEAAREVTATLAGMSTTSLADQLLAAMAAAGNEGRFAVLDAGPQAAYTASEILDANTCAPCAGIDGHVFASLDDARAAYANGAYTGCLGALRCRGTVVANWDDVTPEPPPFGEPRAAFDPGEARDDRGRWTGNGGSLVPKGPETPIPPDHPGNRILDTWVTQGGSGKLDARQRDVLNAMVGYYGKQVPAGLVRGEHDQPASRYKPGKVLRLAPASFSAEETSALPYAEAGDRNPAVLHVTFPQGLKGLNVSGRAEREGFNEQEWVVAAKFRVTGSHVDGEGITHVQIRYAANVEAAAGAAEVQGGFDPALHPRDERGRFGRTGGGGSPAAPASPAAELMGNALWESGQGVVTPTPAEAAAAARTWYSRRALATNMFMRGQYSGGSPPADFTADAASFTGLINRSPAFTRPALTYRGVQHDTEVFGPPGTAKGKTFTDKGFVSVSGKYDTAQAYADAMLLVHIPPGVHALHADQGIWAAAGNPSYYTADGVREYTLPPGTRFTVNADEPANPETGAPRTLDVAVLPPGPAKATARAAAPPEPPPEPGPAPDLADPGGLPGGDRFAWQPGDIEFDGEMEG